MARRKGIDNQPVSSVVWVDRHELHANTYNPNRVAPPELRLLRLSIVEDGWTQPIVARSDGEIVDGFHRWMCSAHPEVAILTGGMVPVVYLPDDVPMAQQMMATIRHNRARGQHLVLPMADIVRLLRDEYHVPPEEIERRLQMEDEEVDRLYDASGMPARAGQDDFNKGWKPT